MCSVCVRVCIYHLYLFYFFTAFVAFTHFGCEQIIYCRRLGEINQKWLHSWPEIYTSSEIERAVRMTKEAINLLV